LTAIAEEDLPAVTGLQVSSKIAAADWEKVVSLMRGGWARIVSLLALAAQLTTTIRASPKPCSVEVVR
jgi:negative regulator of sigma E activity